MALSSSEAELNSVPTRCRNALQEPTSSPTSTSIGRWAKVLTEWGPMFTTSCQNWAEISASGETYRRCWGNDWINPELAGVSGGIFPGRVASNSSATLKCEEAGLGDLRAVCGGRLGVGRRVALLALCCFLCVCVLAGLSLACHRLAARCGLPRGFVMGAPVLETLPLTDDPIRCRKGGRSQTRPPFQGRRGPPASRLPRSPDQLAHLGPGSAQIRRRKLPDTKKPLLGRLWADSLAPNCTV